MEIALFAGDRPLEVTMNARNAVEVWRALGFGADLQGWGNLLDVSRPAREVLNACMTIIERPAFTDEGTSAAICMSEGGVWYVQEGRPPNWLRECCMSLARGCLRAAWMDGKAAKVYFREVEA